MNFIKFKKLWEDADTMLQLELAASNSRTMCTQDFYIYPDEFKDFADQLNYFFPKLGQGEVLLEYGSRSDQMYSFVKIRVSYKGLSMLKIEIETDNNRNDDELAHAHFFINISSGELNALGHSLRRWISSVDTDFVYDWKNT